MIRARKGEHMKVIYECGYDGKKCELYKVKLDKEGNVKEQKFECQGKCDRCHFMGEPWARVVMK